VIADHHFCWTEGGAPSENDGDEFVSALPHLAMDERS
jgi:hypothetical protein